MSKYPKTDAAAAPAADPAADLLARLRATMGDALQVAHDIDHLVETTRQRGALRADERSRLMVWQNDAAAAFAVVETLRKAENYLVNQRTDPMAS